MLDSTQEISSSSNQLIKLASSLNEKKHRDSLGLFLVEGPKLILEALKAKFKLKNLFVLDNALGEDIVPELIINSISEDKIYRINSKLLKKISNTENPNNLIAIFEKREANTQIEFSALNLFCERIQDPGNLGAIVRSALAANCTNIFCDECADIYNPKVIRASAGSIFHANIFTNSIQDLLKYKQEENLIFIATSPRAELNYLELDLNMSNKHILMLGNEGQGLKQESFEKSNINIRIDINPQVESLNALAATTLLVFEMQRKLSI